MFLSAPALAEPSVSTDLCAAHGPDYVEVAGSGRCVRIGEHVRAAMVQRRAGGSPVVRDRRWRQGVAEPSRAPPTFRAPLSALSSARARPPLSEQHAFLEGGLDTLLPSLVVGFEPLHRERPAACAIASSARDRSLSSPPPASRSARRESPPRQGQHVERDLRKVRDLIRVCSAWKEPRRATPPFLRRPIGDDVQGGSRAAASRRAHDKAGKAEYIAVGPLSSPRISI